jgi:aspartyl-tRNA synthetase
MLRTHKINEINEKLIEKKVQLAGWVDTIREHGNVMFLDLRDRYGKIQCVISKKSEDFTEAKKVTIESCVQIEGKVKGRPKGSENKDLSTGKVEVSIDSFKIINKSTLIPFELDKEDLSDDLRLKYRFLDLRREVMKDNLLFRSKVASLVRNFFISEDFIEIETPLLVKSTPEGARDYVVPSRVNKGEFYALPQSPQLYKQILMISGIDRYFQLAKCLRDEDLRQDRQPEHTQIDLEMSFVEPEDIRDFVERMFKHIFKEALGVKLSNFEVLTYKESMKKYGTDKPDLRKNKDDRSEFAFCWVTDFPLFAKNDDGTWTPEHHMFTMPKEEHIKFLESDPSKVEGNLFDLVLNGTELASGGMRISSPELQEKVMKVIGMSKKEANEKFGFLLDAYSYGGPVHGGMGIGFDRVLALMKGTNDIREVIAFPKNKAAQCPMDDSPSPISNQQLKDAHIKLDVPAKKKK